MKKYILATALAITAAAGLTGCSEEDLNSESIFDTTEDKLDPNSATYKFDRWIQENYLKPYNMQFIYRMEQLATDMNYNLVPARLDKAQELAVLTKYLWYDVYAELVSQEFLRQYGPKIIHLIGSSAVNPANGTEILGLAEGGLKVSLFKVNQLDTSDAEQLNEKYFKTMHHEFSHILHQTKTYPREFDLLNAKNYEPMGWQDRSGGTMASLGFTSPYASSQGREDFAETIANFITRTDDQWELTLWLSKQGWFSDDKDAFCYYYYATQSDREKDVKTYCGYFQEVEQVYSITNALGKLDSDGELSIGNASKEFKTVADIEAYLNSIRERYELYPVEDSDGSDGYANILQKVAIAREWLESAWNLDLDALRAEVQKRQSHIDMDVLLAEIDNMQ